MDSDELAQYKPESRFPGKYSSDGMHPRRGGLDANNLPERVVIALSQTQGDREQWRLSKFFARRGRCVGA